MRITESKLKKIITEEVERIITEEGFPSEEEILNALEIVSEAPPEMLRENLDILQLLVLRAKKS